MIEIWSAYGIENTESNDWQGMANQLKNLMKKRKLDRLPSRGYVQKSADELLLAIKDANQSFELKDLKMLSVMPDLLVSDFGQRTHWSDEIGTHERLENYETVVSCEALRKHASELIAAIG